MATIVGYLNYTTEEGDRWDNIAFKAYGDVEQMPVLLAANREAGIPEQFPAGITLRVPRLANTELTSPEQRPPWNRS